MDSTQPRIDTQTTADGTRLAVLGRWTSAQVADAGRWQALQGSLSAVPRGATGKAGPNTAAWDLRGIEQLDHIGAQLLWKHWGGAWPARIELLPAQRAVLEHVARFTTAAPAWPARTLKQRYLALGEIICCCSRTRAALRV